MIKATTESGSVILGLTAENLKRLKANQPIAFCLSEIGLEPRKVMICYGKDEQAIARSLGVDPKMATEGNA